MHTKKNNVIDATSSLCLSGTIVKLKGHKNYIAKPQPSKTPLTMKAQSMNLIYIINILDLAVATWIYVQAKSLLIISTDLL